jgi:hypothetical protein
MVLDMARRDRFALVAVTAVMVVSAALFTGGLLVGSASASGDGVAVSATGQPGPAVVRITPPVPPVPRGLPQAVAGVTLVSALLLGIRRRSMRGLPFRIGDVGDRWRALLFGAPPQLL